MILLLVIAVAVIIALVGSLPTWPHSKNWGYYPASGISLLILVILALYFTGHLRIR
jgi:hypothetical protein